MWLFYTTCNLVLFSYIGYKIFRRFYPLKFKSFEDKYENDQYIFLCIRLKFKDGSDDQITEEITKQEIEDIHEKNEIEYIILEYMFNGKFMKFLSYERDITFPIYNFNVTPTIFPYYPEIILLNGEDVTCYISPYLGPLCNFYVDRGNTLSLKDSLRDHPNINNLDLNCGTLEFISNETPFEGNKHIVKELPCRLNWKRHAAVDPRNDKDLAHIKNFKMKSNHLTPEDFEVIEKNK
jgi:hypothetical protein